VARIFLAVVCCCTVCSGIGAQPSQTQNQPETALLRTLASPQPVPNESIARQHLKEILSRPEFQEISRAPGLWEQWKRQLAAWILRKFQALFESIAKHPGTGATVFRVSAHGNRGTSGFDTTGEITTRSNRLDSRSAYCLAGG
jgi:hypothetical protein